MLKNFPYLRSNLLTLLMTFYQISTRLFAAFAVLFIASCANQKPAAGLADPGNPHPPGSHDHFKAEPTYLKTLAVWKNQELLDRTHAENSSILINLATQRGFLMNGTEIAMDYPICSGTRSRPTPPGTYYILEKTADKRSNLYGRIYDAEGKVVNSDADALTDPIPEGGRFEGAPMRYWMRMTNDGVGHHVGPMPKSRRPSSHSCVRGPSATIPIVFSKVKSGTRIIVE